MTALAPERSLVQRMDALGRANEIRVRRAALKRDLKAGRTSIVDVLLAPPPCMVTAKVFDLLRAVPKHGRVKADKVLQVCRISPSKTVDGLSARQRAELLRLLRGAERTVPIPGRAPLGVTPGAQHMVALYRANDIRFARATLKAEIAAGETSVADVLRSVPVEAETMTLGELLMAQHRWGRSRIRRFLRPLVIGEGRQLTALTERQRGVIADALSPVAPTFVVVAQNPFTLCLHLLEPTGLYTGCGREPGPEWTTRRPVVWHGGERRCNECIRAASVHGWEVAGA